MKDLKTASRYAKSLLELAIEQKNLDRIHDDMLFIQQTLTECKNLGLLIKSPIVKADKKSNVINKVFEGKIDKLSLSYLNIIIRKKRETLLDEIIEVFILQYNDFKGIETVSVTSAVPLSDKNRKELIDKIKKEIGEKIELKEVVDEKIIGGIIIRNNDLQYDQSIRRKLKKIETKLV